MKNIIINFILRKRNFYCLLLILVALLSTSCSYGKTDEILCEDLNFVENTNAEQICSYIYDYYDSYLGGNLENYLSCIYDDCIDWCVSDVFFEEINPKNDEYQEFLEVCDDFINGRGGYGEIYLEKNEAEELSKWCANNFFVSDNYSDCVE